MTTLPMTMTTLCYLEQNDSYLMMHRVKKKQDMNQDKWIGVGGHAAVSYTHLDVYKRQEQQFLWMKEQGFDVVEYKKVTGVGIPKAVQEFSEAIVHNDFPSDGLVSTCLLYTSRCV